MTDNITKYKARILTNSLHSPNVKNTVYELEVRFNDTSQTDYTKLTNLLDKCGLTKTTTTQTDYTINGKRNTSTVGYHNGNVPIYNVEIIDKKEIFKTFDKTYNFRLALSTETVQSSSNLPSDSSYRALASHIRKKERTSFSTGIVRFDLTKVEQSDGEMGRVFEKYEIEIEMVGEITEPKLNEMEKAVYYVINSLQAGTVNIYTYEERTNLIHFYNKVLKAPITNIHDKKGNPVLSHFVMSNARNLRLSDCREGYIYSEEKESYNYTFTHKADGIRRLLIFDEVGVWLVYAPGIFNLVFRYTDFDPNSGEHEYLTSLIGTIFDGEEIQTDMRVPDQTPTNPMNFLHYYVPFDCMAIKGDKQIQLTSLLERQSAIAILDVFNKIENNILHVYQKEFLSVSSPGRMFTILYDLESKRYQLPFKTDGYLVTPNNSPYFTDLSRVPLHRRNLRDHPEICKLKPEDELTIDLRISLKTVGTTTTISLIANKVTSRGNNGQTTITPVKYEGSAYNKFNSDTDVKWDLEAFKSYKDGDIIEFKPIFPEVEGEKIYLAPKMIRAEKPQPNKLDIVNAVWDDIHRPFRIDTLNGKTFDLVRQYHNQTKKALIQSIHDDAQVIDIGFGRGGDINKYRGPGNKNYKGFSKYLAIEPNTENIAEFEGRKKSIFNWVDIEPRFKLLNMYGQDPRIVGEAAHFFGWKEGIPSGKPLVISMMISLSFFFGPDNAWKGLRDNIKKMALISNATSVTFIGMTVDGERVKRMFDPSTKFDPNVAKKTYSKGNVKIDLGVAQMSYDNENTVTVNVNNSIVRNQTEFLVPTTSFISELKPSDVAINECDGETILTPQEKIFSSTFVTFIATLKEGGVNTTNTFKSMVAPTFQRFVPPVVKHPVYKTTPEGVKYVLVSNNEPDHSIFACIGNVGIPGPNGKRTKVSGGAVRGYYLHWLMKESDNPGATLANFPIDPVKGKYRDMMTRNANFYIYEPYVAMFPTGFSHLHEYLASKHPFQHQYLTLIGYCFKVKFQIIDKDTGGVLGEISDYQAPSPDTKTALLAFSAPHTYYNLAIEERNGKITYAS